MPELSATDHGHRTAQALLELQARLCERLGAADGHAFGRDEWQRAEGGGGIARALEGGGVFEKGGVLYSAINGRDIPPVVLAEHPDVQPGTPYFATGVSLILHPHNPYVPTVHFNVRYFEVGEVFWYGGGMDLTPYYSFREDCIHFHRTIKAACDRFDPDYYPRFKPWCDRYFYLKHREEPRGIGGIFFNYLRDDRARGLDYVLALGEAFLAAYLPIVERRRDVPFGERERDFQCYRRGRYVEFNLIYDQGTLFGLQSGGRTESILVSLPPVVRWRYDWHPEPGSSEEALQRDFLPPQDWAALKP
ncbi:MAG TPA: oxygen-dependent coproporphyrinogen oxidase [bacterium]|nr:oxygen-dependent coproporphyrinogen oxidase [bacterium]